MPFFFLPASYFFFFFFDCSLHDVQRISCEYAGAVCICSSEMEPAACVSLIFLSLFLGTLILSEKKNLERYYFLNFSLPFHLPYMLIESVFVFFFCFACPSFF